MGISTTRQGSSRVQEAEKHKIDSNFCGLLVMFLLLFCFVMFFSCLTSDLLVKIFIYFVSETERECELKISCQQVF